MRHRRRTRSSPRDRTMVHRVPTETERPAWPGEPAVVTRINWPRVALVGLAGGLVMVVALQAFPGVNRDSAPVPAPSPQVACRVSTGARPSGQAPQIALQAVLEGADDALQLGLSMHGPRDDPE